MAVCSCWNNCYSLYGKIQRELQLVVPYLTASVSHRFCESVELYRICICVCVWCCRFFTIDLSTCFWFRLMFEHVLLRFKSIVSYRRYQMPFDRIYARAVFCAGLCWCCTSVRIQWTVRIVPIELECMKKKKYTNACSLCSVSDKTNQNEQMRTNGTKYTLLQKTTTTIK